MCVSSQQRVIYIFGILHASIEPKKEGVRRVVCCPVCHGHENIIIFGIPVWYTNYEHFFFYILHITLLATAWCVRIHILTSASVAYHNANMLNNLVDSPSSLCVGVRIHTARYWELRYGGPLCHMTTSEQAYSTATKYKFIAKVCIVLSDDQTKVEIGRTRWYPIDHESKTRHRGRRRHAELRNMAQLHMHA